MQEDSALTRIIYEQLCQDFRSLNEIMWRVPILVMGLTGGLGVAVATFDLSDPARRAVLVLMAGVNFAFILVLWRLRIIMDKLLKKIHEIQGEKHKKGYFVVGILSIILFAGGAGSTHYAWNVEQLFNNNVQMDVLCSSGAASMQVVDKPENGRALLEVTCI